MKSLLIVDKENDEKVYKSLIVLAKRYFIAKGYEMHISEISRESVTYCKGCFGCWIKSPVTVSLMTV
jgi:multimeric flavodoxin WrbA